MKVIQQILFIPTYACNLRCKYCYLGDRRERPSQADFSGVVPAATKLAGKIVESGYRIHEVLFHGAETTTLPPELLADAINMFKPALSNKGMICIQTNGINLTPDYMTSLENRLDKSVRLRFSISLDGPEDITDKNRGRGTYARVMENFRSLSRRGYPAGLFGVFTGDMIDRLDDMAVWITELSDNHYSWRFQLEGPPHAIPDEKQIQLANWLFERKWQSLYNMLDNFVCMWNGNKCLTPHFHANGASMACDRVCDVLPVKWTDVSFVDIVEARRGWFSGAETSEKCERCPMQTVCHSGCPVFRVNGVSHECVLRKTLFCLEANSRGVPLSRVMADHAPVPHPGILNMPCIGELIA